MSGGGRTNQRPGWEPCAPTTDEVTAGEDLYALASAWPLVAGTEIVVAVPVWTSDFSS
jgi:hypothetical protein